SFNAPSPSALYTLSLHDALPILPAAVRCGPGLVMHFSTALPDGSWLAELRAVRGRATQPFPGGSPGQALPLPGGAVATLAERVRSEEHTSELQSRFDLVCRLLLE